MRRRLVVLAAATTITVTLAFLVPLAIVVRTLARDRALSAAELEAQSLAPVLALTSEPEALAVAVRSIPSGAAGRMTIFLPDGTLVGARETVGADSLALARRGRSFSSAVEGGVEVLVPVDLRGGRAVVRVFVPDVVLHEGVAAAWALEAMLGLALSGGTIFMADRLARSVVRPVRAMADAAIRLGEGDLTVRVEPEGPDEIAHVASAFNRLGQRVGELLTTERELVADLSHRLRTPLTALRLDSEAIRDPVDGERIREGVDELQRAVDMTILRARGHVRSDFGAQSDAAQVAKARLDFWAPLAEDQGRSWRFDSTPGPHPVPVAADDLEAVVDALLGNVFAHTNEGTPFRVLVNGRPGGGTRLVVEDRGPGLAASLV
ncbi:MAG: sensor histidine kinase, partial [Actinomycetota bacterium]